MQVYEVANKLLQSHVIVKEVDGGLAFIKRPEIIGIVFKERTLVISGLQGLPMQVSPIAVITDSKVANKRLFPTMMLYRYCELHNAAGRHYAGTVAIGLLHIVFVLLY